MYKIYTCPDCKMRFVAKLEMDSQENGISEADIETIEHILNCITIKTLSDNGELEENIQDALRPLIHNEQLYAEVMGCVRAVCETRI